MSVVNLSDIEEDKRRREVELDGELHVVDMFSSCAQFLSPRRLQELNALAELIRDKVEPHVHTKLQRGQIVQPDKDADEFPHIKAMFETELAFAYSILAATGRRDERKDFAVEGNRLSLQGYDGIRQNPTYSSNFLNALLRIATKHYFYVAWYRLQQTHTGVSYVSDETIYQELENSIEFYQSALRAIYGMDKQVVRPLQKLTRDIREKVGYVKLGIGLEERFREEGQKNAHQIARNVATSDHVALLQDVLFGLARAYALRGEKTEKLGDKVADFAGSHIPCTLKGAIKAFRTLFQDTRIEPSAALIKNIDILERDAAESKGLPFVSDSAEINNETAREIVEKFGKTGPRLWTPDQKPQIQFALTDLVERINQVRILAERCRPI